jgi:hypothetical protein
MDLFENTYTCFAFAATYVFFVIVARGIAKRKGLDPTPYFALAIFLTPLVGIIAAAVARPNREKDEQLRLATGTEKKCPFCAELVKREAIVCRFCGKDLPAEVPATPSQTAPRFRNREEYESWKAGEERPK